MLLCSVESFATYVVVLLALTSVVNSRNVSITAMRTLSEYRNTKVILTCSTDEEGQSFVFYRRLGMSTDRIITNTTGAAHQLSFNLTPDLEGFYFCQVDDTSSTNEVELVGK